MQGGAVIRQPADPKLSLHGLVYMWGVGLACKTGHTALRDEMIPLNTEIVQYSASQTLAQSHWPHNLKLTEPGLHLRPLSKNTGRGPL